MMSPFIGITVRKIILEYKIKKQFIIKIFVLRKNNLLKKKLKINK